jgi:hypothetical protein
MKQTAVEWLQEKYWKKLSTTDDLIIFEQAKEIEKQQQEDCWDIAHQAGSFEGKGIAEENWQTFETYWKETFKSE